MDAINRRMATEALLEFAMTTAEKQYILLTPQVCTACGLCGPYCPHGRFAQPVFCIMIRPLTLHGLSSCARVLEPVHRHYGMGKHRPYSLQLQHAPTLVLEQKMQ